MECFSVKRNHLVGFVVLMFAVTCAWAQTGTTSLHGVVTDNTGAAIAGAKVILSNPSSALHRETSPGSTGEYEFVGLPPGRYVLSVERTTFRKYE